MIKKQYQFIKDRGQLNEVTSAPQQRMHREIASHALPGDRMLRGTIPQTVIELFPESIVRENMVFPLSSDGETVLMAAVDVDDIALRDKLSFILNRNIRLVAASKEAILEAIDGHYDPLETESADSMLCEFTDTELPFEYSEASIQLEDYHPATTDNSSQSQLPQSLAAERFRRRSGPAMISGIETPPRLKGSSMFFYIVEEGQRVLKVKNDGSMEILEGPKRVWKGKNKFYPMKHYVAHPGEFLVVRYRDGRQEHHAGPADLWLDPRVHREIVREEALQLADKEAVVVYAQQEGSTDVKRRIVYGPGLFIPKPGEWLHTFSWHASKGGHLGVEKVPNGLVFQKLWLMPDQMYHDVRDVRTADDAVLTIRLMLFFELVDIERMLETTHDPIGDFVNATTSDVVDLVGRDDFESFKRNTDQLNGLEAYRQLTARAQQTGYRISKFVYRGYGAADSLQQMHDQAIEARTRLQLERATEQQAQDLENYKLDCQIDRAEKRRTEQGAEVTHDLELSEQRKRSAREQKALEAELQANIRRQSEQQQQEHLRALQELGVDLTAYLTQGRADRIIEVRGNGTSPHIHLTNESEQT